MPRALLSPQRSIYSIVLGSKRHGSIIELLAEQASRIETLMVSHNVQFFTETCWHKILAQSHYQRPFRKSLCHNVALATALVVHDDPSWRWLWFLDQGGYVPAFGLNETVPPLERNQSQSDPHVNGTSGVATNRTWWFWESSLPWWTTADPNAGRVPPRRNYPSMKGGSFGVFAFSFSTPEEGGSLTTQGGWQLVAYSRGYLLSCSRHLPLGAHRMVLASP